MDANANGILAAEGKMPALKVTLDDAAFSCAATNETLIRLQGPTTTTMTLPRYLPHPTPLRTAVVAIALLLAGCATPPPAPPAPAPIAAPVETAPVPPPSPAPAVAPPPVAPAPPPVTPEPPREAAPIELPDYARRGKRLPADGGAPGRAVLAYCRSFELDRDAGAYYNRLQREKRLPREDEIAQRNQQSGQTLTLRQYVERDWALRRDNNRSAPQRCKVLGGSIEGNTALVVFEADLNGRRQRGTATVQLTSKAWKVRDHGDWAPVK